MARMRFDNPVNPDSTIGVLSSSGIRACGPICKIRSRFDDMNTPPSRSQQDIRCSLLTRFRL